MLGRCVVVSILSLLASNVLAGQNRHNRPQRHLTFNLEHQARVVR
jgi:hypothetical protein